MGRPPKAEDLQRFEGRYRPIQADSGVCRDLEVNIANSGARNGPVVRLKNLEDGRVIGILHSINQGKYEDSQGYTVKNTWSGDTLTRKESINLIFLSEKSTTKLKALQPKNISLCIKGHSRFFADVTSTGYCCTYQRL
jgi:hypothetical protein